MAIVASPAGAEGSRFFAGAFGLALATAFPA
jgi:hypothetical protein